MQRVPPLAPLRWPSAKCPKLTIDEIDFLEWLPIDNSWVESQIRPIPLGRSNWPSAGSLRSGQRAAAIMSLLLSARINGHDPSSTCATRWSGCRYSQQAGSLNFCRIVDEPARRSGAVQRYADLVRRRAKKPRHPRPPSSMA
jgi:hypothetical protein